MSKILFFILTIGFATNAFGHGNHESATVKPQKGGVVKSLETVHLELVQIQKELRLYIFSTDLKLQDPDKYNISANVVLPRGKGKKDIIFKKQKKHLITSFDAKNLHRYDLIIFITQGGHKDRVVFTIETKNR